MLVIVIVDYVYVSQIVVLDIKVSGFIQVLNIKDGVVMVMSYGNFEEDL